MAYPSAGQTASSNTIKQAPTIQSSIEEFDGVLSRLETLANRAGNCSDRVLGSRPSEVRADEAPPAPGNLIHLLQCRRERLLRAVDHLETEIGRMETGLA